MFLLLIGEEFHGNREINITPLPPPYYYEGNYSNQQNAVIRYPTPMGMVSVPTQGGRYYATNMGRMQIVTSPPQRTTIIDDVLDIDDFMGCNIFACLCCLPLGLIGIIFSMLCDHAKSKGKRVDAEYYSLVARFIFIFSVICGISAAIVIVHFRHTLGFFLNYFH